LRGLHERLAQFDHWASHGIRYLLSLHLLDLYAALRRRELATILQDESLLQPVVLLVVVDRSRGRLGADGWTVERGLDVIAAVVLRILVVVVDVKSAAILRREIGQTSWSIGFALYACKPRTSAYMISFTLTRSFNA
jgi:hypothetical protein